MIFDDLSVLVAEPLEWSIAAVTCVYKTPDDEWSLQEKPGYKLAGFIHPVNEWAKMTFDELPVEFFNHQLLEYDSNSNRSITEFVKKWGFPFFPLRNMAPEVTAWSYQDKERISDAFDKTAAIKDLAYALGAKYFEDEIQYDSDEPTEEELEDYGEDFMLQRTPPSYGDVIPDASEAEYYRGIYAPDNIGIQDAISLEEAALTIETLQIAMANIMQMLKDGTPVHARHLDVINMGSSFSHLLHWQGAYSGASTNWQLYSLLSSAICNQIIESFADKAPWRECACEGCGVIFKRKQSKAKSPASDSVYCCTACEERQKKRNQRAAAKNRLKH